MSNPRMPLYIVIEDPLAAYLARHYGLTPEGDELREIVIREYGGCCACCGLDDIQNLTLDHIKPVKGGKRKKYAALWREGYPKDNLQILCMACNQLKAASSQRLCPHAIFARHLVFYASLLIQATAGGERPAA